MKHPFFFTVPLFCIFLAFSNRVEATDYYVDQNNPSSNDTNPGTASSPWKTITKANSTLQAGDRVYIKAATYTTSHIEPARSGTATQPITYTNFGTDVVNISNQVLGVQLIGRNYITVKGINCTNVDTFLNLEGSSHNNIDRCTFLPMRNLRLWQGSRLYFSSQYNWIHDCTFAKYGINNTQDNGEVLAIGEEDNTSDFSDYNLIERNIFYHGGHDVVGVYSRHNVIRDNYFHNENWQNNHGNRSLILAGFQVNSGWNLIEGNKFGYSGYPADADGAPGLTITTQRNIVRRNSFYHNNENGLLLSYTSNYSDIPSNNRIYNNTFFNNGFNPLSPNEARCGLGFARWTGTQTIVGNIVKNNLFWANTTAIASYGVDMAAQTVVGNWLQTSNPFFVNASTTLGDPFVSTLPNLALQSNSPCINTGIFIAKISSPSGSGTTFRVDEAGYFMNGWGIVLGDQIQLQGSTQRVRITQIDYSTNTITVDASLTWTQNQGVSLGYVGSAPDLGAFEYATPGSTPAAPTNLRIVP